MGDRARGSLIRRGLHRARWEAMIARQRTVRAARRASAPARVGPPNFLIIGGRKCGTTSLYAALLRHPGIIGAPLKEPHYLDFNWSRGLGWYRSQFPLAARRDWVRRRTGLEPMIGEKTTYYICYPHAPKRALETNPDMKIIALLRDPVRRAYSHYLDELAYETEHGTFEEALEREQERLEGEVERMVADPSYLSRPHYRWSYLAQGRYLEQLERWWEAFPENQILVVRSEDLFERPAETVDSAVQFLGLPPHRLAEYPRLNAHDRPPPIRAETLESLAAHFQEPNERLYARLGRDLQWSRPRGGSGAGTEGP
jgi:hypothetical protein